MNSINKRRVCLKTSWARALTYHRWLSIQSCPDRLHDPSYTKTQEMLNKEKLQFQLKNLTKGNWMGKTHPPFLRGKDKKYWKSKGRQNERIRMGVIRIWAELVYLQINWSPTTLNKTQLREILKINLFTRLPKKRNRMTNYIWKIGRLIRWLCWFNHCLSRQRRRFHYWKHLLNMLIIIYLQQNICLICIYWLRSQNSV